jgi:hypothetical protein
VILLLMGVGALSYYLTMLFLQQTERAERTNTYEHVITVNPGSLESSNLIYSYEKKTGEIKAMVLELFDAGTANMTYLTIPANTQITLSSGTYRDLQEKSAQLPQVVTMSDLNTYFSGDVAYEYGILILQEEINAEIGYFTAMEESVFDQCFEKESGSVLIYRPTESLLTEASKCETESDMKDFIESKWDDLISDLTLSQKQHYADALKNVDPDLIYTHRVYGSESGSVFLLSENKNAKFIEKVWEKKAYKKAQGKNGSKKADTSETKDTSHSIWIYNGSKITGLAAKYQQKLENDGYTVKGVGNATGEVRTSTTIYVKKKKMASGIRGYFKNPVVKVETNTSSGADIEIILGTEDDLQ